MAANKVCGREDFHKIGKFHTRVIGTIYGNDTGDPQGSFKIKNISRYEGNFFAASDRKYQVISVL